MFLLLEKSWEMSPSEKSWMCHQPCQPSKKIIDSARKSIIFFNKLIQWFYSEKKLSVSPTMSLSEKKLDVSPTMSLSEKKVGCVTNRVNPPKK